MEDNREQDNKKSESELRHIIAQSEERLTIASKAGRLIDKEIAQAHDFTPEEAARLASLRLEYSAQGLLHMEDKLRAKAQLEGKDWGVVADHIKKSRMEAEYILSQATQGNYVSLKEYFKKESKNLLDIARKDPEIAKVANEGLKLSELEAAIPERGKPFELPPPSWQDPKIINAPDVGGGVWL